MHNDEGRASLSVQPEPTAEAFSCIERCCREMIQHDGFGELKIETRILKRGQKELIVHFGKQYRFVVNSVGEAKQAGKEGQ